MSEKNVTVVALMKAKPGLESRLKQELSGLIAPSRKDPGCINYDLHVDPANPGSFMFHENWTSKKLLDSHLKTPHLKAFLSKADALLDGPPQINIWEKI